MVWALDEYDDEIIRQIERQGDRSAAILAASCLEDRLSKLLRTALDDDVTVANFLFKGYGPLATFQSKIDLAYMMGMCDARMRKTIIRIKDIRNEFAHSPRATSFKTQRIADICSNFEKITKKPKNYKPISVDADIVAYLMHHKPGELYNLALVSSSFGRDSPRRRYLLAVKLTLTYLFILEALIKYQRELATLQNGEFWPWSSQRKDEQPALPVPQTEGQARKTQRPRRRSSRG